MRTAIQVREASRPTGRITIRRASLDDRQSLRAMQHLALRTLALGDYTRGQIESCIADGLTMDDYLVSDGTYFIAEVEGQIAGSGGYTTRTPGYGTMHRKSAGESANLSPVRLPLIRSMFVHPAWARCGVGSAVLRACEAEILAAGHPIVELDALLSGVPLYRSAGYAPAGKSALVLSDGEQMQVVRMRKVLAPAAHQEERP